MPNSKTIDHTHPPIACFATSRHESIYNTKIKSIGQVNNKTHLTWLRKQRSRIEKELKQTLPKGNSPLAVAMRYAVLDGGKRLRPLLCLATANDFGTDHQALYAGCAVELVHCYSLVHDDLPCMDDDVYRRGKLSCYAKYGEALALLVGDGLLSLAFALLAKANLGDEATTCLAQAAGPAGMIGGQAIDIAGTATDVRKLRTMHTRKTGALIQATIALGGMSAKVNKNIATGLATFGKDFGLLYQIADDINDVVGTMTSTGKTPGKDKTKGRQTYVTIMGLPGARRHLHKVAKQMQATLNTLPGPPVRLSQLCELFFPELVL